MQYTVLAIDDDLTALKLLTDLLSPEGFTVLVAEDGESGIDRAKFARPDLILLDVMMPGINGFAVCDLLRQHEETKDIPVIFLTALSKPLSRSAGSVSGGDGYITKPFDFEMLLARIRSRLNISLEHKFDAIRTILGKDISAEAKLLSIASIIESKP